MWFWRRKEKRLGREEALAVRPTRMVSPDAQATADGGLRLTVRLRPGRANRWLLRLPEGATKTFELDPVGAFVWEQCDGRTSVQQIIRRLARQYNFNLREAEVATVTFLRMLVKKGLLGMVPRERKAKETQG